MSTAVIYFANPTGSSIEHMISGDLGYIDTPRQGNKRPEGVQWCADNGCFNDATFDENQWWEWLTRNKHDAAQCRFATAPDVMGDHEATLKRSAPWLPKIRELGYPAALVAQDGATPDNLPWNEFDAIFIGGTTDFKLSQTAIDIIVEGKRRKKWVHVGRINSRRRYRRFAVIADSCDGTYLVFGPDINLPKLLTWVKEHQNSPALFDLKESQ